MATINQGLIIKELSLIGSKIVTDAKRYASWSNAISDSLSVKKVEPTNAGYMIEIKSDLKKAPQATAFEFGSGIHATRGKAGKYIIKPRNKSSLAIPEERWTNFQFPVIPGQKMLGQSEETGKFLLRFVEHPGVAPKPFLAPAVRDNMPEIKTRLLKTFGLAVKSLSTRVEIIK